MITPRSSDQLRALLRKYSGVVVVELVTRSSEVCVQLRNVLQHLEGNFQGQDVVFVRFSGDLMKRRAEIWTDSFPTYLVFEHMRQYHLPVCVEEVLQQQGVLHVLDDLILWENTVYNEVSGVIQWCLDRI